MKYYVYQLRLDGAPLPFYIGKGKGKRASAHFSKTSLRKHSHKNNTILKAMGDGIAVLTEIIHQNLSEPDALMIEESMIRQYGRAIDGGCLTNATLGGEGMSGYKASEETKAKMSESAKKVIKDDAWKTKIGVGRTGKRHTEESKAAIRAAATGRRHSELSKIKMTVASTGRKHSEETKNKIAMAAKKRMLSDKSRAAISVSMKEYKMTDGHANNIMFARWSKNNAYSIADQIYEKWSDMGMPGTKVMESTFTDLKLVSLVRRFTKGWNPSDDPTWLKYKSRIDDVSKSAEPVHVLESHL